MRLGKFSKTILIQGFNKSHIRKRSVKLFGNRKTSIKKRTKGQYGRLSSPTNHARFSQHNFLKISKGPRSTAPRIPHRHGSLMRIPEIKHRDTLSRVGGRHNNHVWHTAQKRYIESPRMRLSVGSHNSRAIDREKHIEILNRHIVNKLIIRTLEKC